VDAVNRSRHTRKVLLLRDDIGDAIAPEVVGSTHMDLIFVIDDKTGRQKGSVNLTVDFSAKTWNLTNDPRKAWPGYSKDGKIETADPRLLWILDSKAGQVPQRIIEFKDSPIDEWDPWPIAQGKINTDGGSIFLVQATSQMTPARARVLDVINKVPNSVSSKTALFKTLTGLSQEDMVKWWDGINKTPEGKTMTNFTSCNAFLSMTAQRAGARQGWLTRGTLNIDRCAKEVPGCWITPDSGRKPKPGDVYSVPLRLKSGQIQQFGHVGIVAEVHAEGTWVSVDGGQGGSSGREDFVKRVHRGKLADSKMNGWVDIDKYCGQ
jgi:hypothetical protein